MMRLFILRVDSDSFIYLLFIVILVSPSPKIMRAIPSTVNSVTNDVIGHGFEVVSPTDFCEEINETCSEIELAVTEFGGLVVPRESVVVVVETFAESEQGDGHVFGRLDVPVIRLVTPFVSSRVDQPCDVQDEGVAEHGADKECVEQTLAPEVHRNSCRHDEATKGHQNKVVPVTITIYVKTYTHIILYL